MKRRETETRDLEAAEVRFALAEDAGTFSGYAAVWGVADSFGDVLRRGAFTRTLRERPQPAFLWSHDPDKPAGVWTSLAEDDRGLKVAGRLALKTVVGAEALEHLKLGSVRGLSIGFRLRSSERGPDGQRIVTDVELLEISLVAMPAQKLALVDSVRSDAREGVATFLEACNRARGALTKR